MSASEAAERGISTHRVEGLADAVFAIVMTLLVIDLRAPHAASTAALAVALFERWTDFFALCDQLRGSGGHVVRSSDGVSLHNEDGSAFDAVVAVLSWRHHLPAVFHGAAGEKLPSTARGRNLRVQHLCGFRVPMVALASCGPAPAHS